MGWEARLYCASRPLLSSHVQVPSKHLFLGPFWTCWGRRRERERACAFCRASPLSPRAAVLGGKPTLPTLLPKQTLPNAPKPQATRAGSGDAAHCPWSHPHLAHPPGWWVLSVFSAQVVSSGRAAPGLGGLGAGGSGGHRGQGSHRPASGRDKGQRLRGSGASAPAERRRAAPAAAAARGARAARGAGGTRPETRGKGQPAACCRPLRGAVNHALPARCWFARAD